MCIGLCLAFGEADWYHKRLGRKAGGARGGEGDVRQGGGRVREGDVESLGWETVC